MTFSRPLLVLLFHLSRAASMQIVAARAQLDPTALHNTTQLTDTQT